MAPVHHHPVRHLVLRVHIQRAVHPVVHPVRTSHRIQHTPVQRATHLRHVHGHAVRGTMAHPPTVTLHVHHVLPVHTVQGAQTRPHVAVVNILQQVPMPVPTVKA